jgi:hypothetical protein
MKQLLFSLVLICVGFGVIAFSFREIEIPLHPSYDNLARILPIAKVLALVMGLVVICLAVIPLFTFRHPVPILTLMLLGIFVGLLVGSLVARRVVPNYRTRVATTAQRTQVRFISYSTATFGGILPLILVVWLDRRRPLQRD